MFQIVQELWQLRQVLLSGKYKLSFNLITQHNIKLRPGQRQKYYANKSPAIPKCRVLLHSLKNFPRNLPAVIYNIPSSLVLSSKLGCSGGTTAARYHPHEKE